MFAPNLRFLLYVPRNTHFFNFIIFKGSGNQSKNESTWSVENIEKTTGFIAFLSPRGCQNSGPERYEKNSKTENLIKTTSRNH